MSLPQYATAGEHVLADEKVDIPQPTQEVNARAPRSRCSRKHRVVLPIFVAVAMVYMLASSARSALPLPRIWGCHRAASSASASLPSHYTLPSGDRIPSVALGVWKAGRGEVGQAVKVALDAGYRHIDDARIYRNEEEVGAAWSESGYKREDLWITSKLWNDHHDPRDVEKSLDASLEALNTTYLDLFLIHWPIAFNRDGSVYNKELTDDPFPTWQKLEELVKKGKIRNIGVSNFNIWRLSKLLSHPNITIPPAINQVELNFWNPQPGLLAWAKAHNVLLEAYSPLGGDGQVGKTLNEPVVQEIANELAITPAQVIISWHVQRGTVVLPKSVTPSRIEENLQVTRLPDALFDKLEAAAVGKKPQRTLNPSKSWGLPFDLFE